MNVNSMFQSPAATTAVQKPEAAKTGGAGFISFLKKPEDNSYAIASFPVGREVHLRLCPASTVGVPFALDVDVLSVKHNGTEGKILAGPWWEVVNKWLLANVRDRFHSFKSNPNGDVRLRTQKRVIFWAFGTPFAKSEEDKPVRTLMLVNLAGTNYPGAKVGDGDGFLPGGDFVEDFDHAQGRVLKFLASGADAKTRTLKITPARVATALTEVDVRILPHKDGQFYVPLLQDVLRVSSKDEIVQCLKETLPGDVFEKLMTDIGDKL